MHRAIKYIIINYSASVAYRDFESKLEHQKDKLDIFQQQKTDKNIN